MLHYSVLLFFVDGFKFFQFNFMKFLDGWNSPIVIDIFKIKWVILWRIENEEVVFFRTKNIFYKFECLIGR